MGRVDTQVSHFPGARSNCVESVRYLGRNYHGTNLRPASWLDNSTGFQILPVPRTNGVYSPSILSDLGLGQCLLAGARDRSKLKVIVSGSPTRGDADGLPFRKPDFNLTSRSRSPDTGRPS